MCYSLFHVSFRVCPCILEGEMSYELWFTIEVDRQPADLTIRV